MSYTGTAGQTGNGTTFSINTSATTTPTWTVIGESVDVTPSGYENKTDDATNLQSTAIERVFTIADGGTWKITANRVSSDAGQTAVQTAFASGVTKQFKIELPKTGSQVTDGDTFIFHAVVTEWNPSIKTDKMVKISGSFATTNGITFTAGS